MNGRTGARSLPRALALWAGVGLLSTVLTAWGLAIINTPELFPEKQVAIDPRSWPVPPPEGWPDRPRPEMYNGQTVADTEWVFFGATHGSAKAITPTVMYSMGTWSAGLP